MNDIDKGANQRKSSDAGTSRKKRWNEMSPRLAQLIEQSDAAEIGNVDMKKAYFGGVPTYGWRELVKNFNIDHRRIIRFWRSDKMIVIRPNGPFGPSFADLRFPTFQFEKSGTPKPIVGEVIDILNQTKMTKGQIALWFSSANGWLDGKRPQDLIDDDSAADPERDGDPNAPRLDVLQAARYEVDPVVG